MSESERGEITVDAKDLLDLLDAFDASGEREAAEAKPSRPVRPPEDEIWKYDLVTNRDGVLVSVKRTG